MKLRSNLCLELSLQAIIFYVSYTLLLSCQNITPSKMKHTPKITINDYGTLPSENFKTIYYRIKRGCPFPELWWDHYFTKRRGQFENIVLGYIL